MIAATSSTKMASVSPRSAIARALMLRFFIAPLLLQQTCVPAWSPLSSYGHRRLRLARRSAPAATDRWIAHDLTAVFAPDGRKLAHSGDDGRRPGRPVTGVVLAGWASHCGPDCREPNPVRGFGPSPGGQAFAVSPRAAEADPSALRGQPRPRRACGPPDRKRSRQTYRSLRISFSSRPKALTFLARQHPTDDTELERSAENTG